MAKTAIQLLQDDPELLVATRACLAVARDPNVDFFTRFEAASLVADATAPLIMESLRQQAEESLAAQPKFKWVNGAKVKV